MLVLLLLFNSHECSRNDLWLIVHEPTSEPLSLHVHNATYSAGLFTREQTGKGDK